jgi:hypothetical protein
VHWRNSGWTLNLQLHLIIDFGHRWTLSQMFFLVSCSQTKQHCQQAGRNSNTATDANALR